MKLYAGCKTTAMGTMPHRDVERALALAMGLDIPFWPQLPRITYNEDMFVQFARDFPGVSIDVQNEKILFETDRYQDELPGYCERIADLEALAVDKNISIVYHRFLEKDLLTYPAIRGHVTGPINLGFQIIDEDGRPVIYNDEARGLLFDFIQQKVNIQYRQLSRKNDNAFVWLDDPGFWWVFSGTIGYNDVQARHDYLELLAGIEGIKALHMCVNVNLPYLLALPVQILSIDAYQFDNMPAAYADAIAGYLNRGGILSWGIVPTESATLDRETPETLVAQLVGYWEDISKHTGIAVSRIAEQALLAPARCCLRNPEKSAPSRIKVSEMAAGGNGPTIEELLVERAFDVLKEISKTLKLKYSL